MEEKRDGLGGQGSSGQVDGTNVPDTITGAAMRQLSRKGALGWFGKAGLGLAGAIAGFSLAPSGSMVALASTHPAHAPDVHPNIGCPECKGVCSPCSSSCVACGTSCKCFCTQGCFACGDYRQAHLMWVLGYIPNCQCESC